ncbi:MAG: DUF721 domain-containing protein [Gammaproteobacteria bacterium]|nr:DUF721 domain-containing protein [Gammaproteobacteria bacterium]
MRTLNTLIAPELLRQARAFESMTRELRTCLKDECATHCWVGGIREQTLVVVTDHAGHATRVHYQQGEILECINKGFRSELPAPLIRLRLKVRPMPEAPVRDIRRPTLSSDNARRLLSTADGIVHAGVKAALQRLARRGDADF